MSNLITYLGNKMEIVIGIVFFLLGGGVGFGISQATKSNEPVVVTGSEVGEKLADIDLVKIPCSEDFIKESYFVVCSKEGLIVKHLL